MGQRVDCDGPVGLHRSSRNQHRQRGLTGAYVADKPQSLSLVEALMDISAILPYCSHDTAVSLLDQQDGLAIERYASESPRQPCCERRSPLTCDSLRSTRARPGHSSLVVTDEAGPVAASVRTSVSHQYRSALEMDMNRGKSFWKLNSTVPSAPLRCFEMIKSAIPSRSDSGS